MRLSVVLGWSSSSRMVTILIMMLQMSLLFERSRIYCVMPLPEQKDRKIDLLRKHLAKRREREEEEARQVEALARDKALQGASNGACR